jgi:hypothetical protein
MSFASRSAGPSQADMWVFVEEQSLDPRPNVEPSPAHLPGRHDPAPRPIFDGAPRDAQQLGDLGGRHHVGGGEGAVRCRARLGRHSAVEGGAHVVNDRNCRQTANDFRPRPPGSPAARPRASSTGWSTTSGRPRCPNARSPDGLRPGSRPPHSTNDCCSYVKRSSHFA